MSRFIYFVAFDVMIINTIITEQTVKVAERRALPEALVENFVVTRRVVKTFAPTGK